MRDLHAQSLVGAVHDISDIRAKSPGYWLLSAAASRTEEFASASIPSLECQTLRMLAIRP